MNVNRLCSSGLQAIVTGAQELLTGQAEVVVAGGNESMSRQPFLDYGARDGWRLGPRELVDGTLSLVTDPFGHYPMGMTAENVAERYDVPREEQDAFAARSQERAVAAIERGHFEDEIVPSRCRGGNGGPSRGRAPAARHDARGARQAPAGLQGRRHGHRRQLGRDQRRRRGGRADARVRGRAARPRAAARLRSWAVSGIEPEVMGYAPALGDPEGARPGRAGSTTSTSSS